MISHKWLSMTRVKARCLCCGEEFWTYTSQVERGGGKFKNREHYANYRRRNYNGGMKGMKIGKNAISEKIEVVCDGCGIIFLSNKSQVKKSNRHFHNVECKNKYSSKNRLNRVERICEVCGNKFSVVPSIVGKGHGRYCSNKCRSVGYGLEHIGENNNAWNGGTSFIPYCEKFNRNFKARVRSFFGNKCLLCGKTKDENGRDMDVHHVHFDKSSCCNNEAPRKFATVCRSCHSKQQFKSGESVRTIEKIIDDIYDGKCFYTIDEYKRLPK